MLTPAEIFAYRINDASRAIGLGRSTLYKLINEGKLKSVTIAGRTLIPRAEIERLIAEAA
jgi:excisionase family DNA binding protein